MIVKKRLKSGQNTIGYIMSENGKDFIIGVNDTYKYSPNNAIRLKNGEYKAKNGNSIDNIEYNRAKIKIENRHSSYIGKARLILVSSYAKLSGTQKRILEQLENKSIAKFDKKKDNISIDMKDLSTLTAYTGIEYSLFARNDKYIIFKGTERGIYIDESMSNTIILKKFKWIGHTHPGTDYNCLIPSDSDYDVLKKIGQKRSVIYNSVGDFYIFGEEAE